MPSTAPVGTVALLFTDMEASTRMAQELGAVWIDVVEMHDALVSSAIVEHDGYIERTEGDSLFAVFESCEAGARAAVAAQRALRGHQWPRPVGEVRVRMGLHVGYVERARMGYVGLEIHRAARVAAAAHGGQLLLTRAAVLASADALQVDMVGVYRLKDFPVPEQLFCARIDGFGAEDFPPPRTLDVRPTNLPAGRPPLIGREAEVTAAIKAAGSARAVTLLGRGGVGKSSLALVVGSEALDRYPGGVWWVELASVGTDAVLSAIAAAVQIPTRTDAPLLDALIRRFTDRGPVLVVLDNLEHLLDIVPTLRTLLDRASNVDLLCTSQAPLRLPGEVIVPVASLGQDAALSLFDARAAQARSGRELSATERVDADAICQALDGLPLAIELAAARLAVLTVAQLRARLGSSLDLLRGGEARPVRQRSLEATVDWTLEMLGAPARALFERLGVFAGAAELEEIESVARGDGLDVLEAVSELVEFSLLARVEVGDGLLRFGLPEALRRLAEKRLSDRPDARRWYRAHAERQLERSWPARLLHMVTHREHAAAIDAQAEALLAIGRMTHDEPALAEALRAIVGLELINLGRIGEAAPILQTVQPDAVSDSAVRAVIYFGRAMQALFTGGEPIASFDRAMEFARRADPQLAVAVQALRTLPLIAANDHSAAIADAAAATERARGIGGPVLVGALSMEGQARLAAGQIEPARARFQESEALSLTWQATSTWSLDSMTGDLAFFDGDLAEALSRYSRSLEGAEQRNDSQQLAFDLIATAGTLARLDEDLSAVEVLGILDAHCLDAGGTRSLMLPVGVGIDETHAAVERLGNNADAVQQRGAAVPPNQRIARAVALATAAREILTSS